MKIILNQDVANLGEEGDVVVVKDGYARNFLLPTKAAVRFNKANEALFASRAVAIEKRKEEKRSASSTLKEKLDKIVLNLVVSAGDSGKLFGSVTAAMIQEALAKLDIEIDRRKIEVATHSIKMVGTYSVRVHLYEDAYSEIKLVVESEAEVRAREAEAARKAAEEARIAAAAKKAEEAAAAAAAQAEAEAQAAQAEASAEDAEQEAEVSEDAPVAEEAEDTEDEKAE